MNKKKAIKILEELIIEGRSLINNVSYKSDKFIIWKSKLHSAIQNIFNNTEKEINILNINYNPPLTWDYVPLSEEIKYCSEGIVKTNAYLIAYINDIEKYWDNKDNLKLNISISLNILFIAYSIIISLLFFIGFNNLWVTSGIILTSFFAILKQYGFLLGISNNLIKLYNTIIKKNKK